MIFYPTPPVTFPLTLPILQIKYIYFVLFPCYDDVNTIIKEVSIHE